MILAGPHLTNRLSQIRSRLGWSQTELANELGLSTRAYQALEGGERPIRRIHVLAAERVLLANKPTIADFTGGKDNRKNRAKVSIVPRPEESRFNNYTVDLTLGSEIIRLRDMIRNGGIIDPASSDENIDEINSISNTFHVDKENGYILNPGEFAISYTEEVVQVPDVNELRGSIFGKSNLARIGLIINSTNSIIMPGFSGRIGLEIVNHSQFPIKLRAGMSICQIGFELNNVPMDEILEAEDIDHRVKI